MSYCLNIVKQHDPSRFFISLLAPAKCRPALWALFAFNYEIAKTREVVSDTTIGLIRLQWWRDAISEIYEDGKVVRRHGVVDELALAINHYNLPRELFDKLIYAREFDLEGVVPTNLEGLINYCDYTTTPLFTLALKIAGETEIDTVIRDISVHYALIGLVRAVPYMLNQRRLMLPQDILSKHEVSEQKLFDFNGKDKIPDVISDVLSQEGGFRNAQVQPKSRMMKGVVKSTCLYQQQIERCLGDVFDARMAQPPRFMSLRIWFATFF